MDGKVAWRCVEGVVWRGVVWRVWCGVAWREGCARNACALFLMRASAPRCFCAAMLSRRDASALRCFLRIDVGRKAYTLRCFCAAMHTACSTGCAEQGWAAAEQGWAAAEQGWAAAEQGWAAAEQGWAAAEQGRITRSGKARECQSSCPDRRFRTNFTARAPTLTGNALPNPLGSEHKTNCTQIPTDVIARLDPDTGRVLSRWGAGQFQLPHFITLDGRGGVFIVDVGAHQVWAEIACGQVSPGVG
eukprot:352907-Chlamydomonas_euryale.AAC.1